MNRSLLCTDNWLLLDSLSPTTTLKTPIPILVILMEPVRMDINAFLSLSRLLSF